MYNNDFVETTQVTRLQTKLKWMLTMAVCHYLMNSVLATTLFFLLAKSNMKCGDDMQYVTHNYPKMSYSFEFPWKILVNSILNSQKLLFVDGSSRDGLYV